MDNLTKNNNLSTGVLQSIQHIGTSRHEDGGYYSDVQSARWMLASAERRRSQSRAATITTAIFRIPIAIPRVPSQLLYPIYSLLNAKFPSHVRFIRCRSIKCRMPQNRFTGSRTTPKIPRLPDFGESNPRNSGLLEAIGLGDLANVYCRSWV